MRQRTAYLIAMALAIGSLIGVAPAGAKGAGGFGSTGTAPDRSVVKPAPGTGARAIAYSADRGRASTSVSAIEAGGAIRNQRELDGRWALPAVTVRGDPGGLSADGETLFVVRPQPAAAPDTTFRLLDTETLRTRSEVTLDGRFVFDAISPDGRLVYLIEYLNPIDFIEYRVRAYDVTAGELRPGTIVDPDEAGEPMIGEPVSRAMSPDGRWAYTLYRGKETFVHALDTEKAKAVCIDLPQFEDVNYFGLDLTVDPGSGAITVLERGDPAAVIDADTFKIGFPAAPGSTTVGEGGPAWAAWALIGAGTGMCAWAIGVRRRRRRSDAVKAGLEEALERESPDAEPGPRPREPVG